MQFFMDQFDGRRLIAVQTTSCKIVNYGQNGSTTPILVLFELMVLLRTKSLFRLITFGAVNSNKQKVENLLRSKLAQSVSCCLMIHGISILRCACLGDLTPSL